MFSLKPNAWFGSNPEAHQHVITVPEAQLLYRWLSIPRYAVVIVSVAAIALFWRLGALYFDPRPVIFGLVPIFVLASFGTEHLIRRGTAATLMLYVQLGIDLFGVTVAILLTGGVDSPFILLYVLLVISASIVSLRTLIVIGSVSSIVYLTLFILENTGVLPAQVLSASAHAAEQTMSIVVFVLSIGLIAFQSSFYVTRIKEKDEEVLKLKDEFMFRTIHDLRSPSTVIRLVFDKYKERAAATASPELTNDFAAVESSLRRMTGLIEDLLKTAAGDSPAFAVRKDPIDLNALIRECAAELAPLMQKRGITFAFAPADGLPKLIGDADKLRETFNNFLDNAIKYNRDGGTIAVRQRLDGLNVVTEVSDTGIGISEKSLSMLFSPYFRGDIGNEIVGTGLGLFMTRKLVQKMGGNVTVRSEKGKGTTFAVTLPLRG